MLFAAGAAALLAALVLRCIQLVLFTDSETGGVTLSGKDTAAQFYIYIFAAAVFFAFYAFSSGSAKSYAQFFRGKALFCLSLLSCAGMFCDFIRRCLGCYYYAAGSEYIALNRLVPMALCSLFALFSCVYFAVMCEALKSSRFDYGRLWFIRLAPVFWAMCSLLVCLTEYSGALYDPDSIMKNFAFAAGMLFFLFLSSSPEDGGKRLKALSFFGLFYGSVCVALSAARIAALIFGAELKAAEYGVPAFLFTGLFAIVLSCRISAEGKV